MSPPSLSAHSDFSCHSTSWGTQPCVSPQVSGAKRPHHDSRARVCASDLMVLAPSEEPLESCRQPTKRLRVSPGNDASVAPDHTQPEGQAQGPECVRIVVHNAPVPPRRGSLPATFLSVEYGEGAPWGHTSMPHGGKIELPPSPRRLNREMRAQSSVP